MLLLRKSTDLHKILPFDVDFTRKNIKNINLRIDRLGKVKLSAPLKCPMNTIVVFLQEKAAWVKTHQERIQKQTSKREASAETHFFLGEAYPLCIEENSHASFVLLKDKQLLCSIKTGTKADIPSLLNHWQMTQMQGLLPQYTEKWEALVGASVDEYKIKAMKSRWGYCVPSKKRICLNLCLMQYPLCCLEYVLVHELVHLLEASHNKRFYTLMGQFMPEWKTYKDKLKLNGRDICA